MPPPTGPAIAPEPLFGPDVVTSLKNTHNSLPLDGGTFANLPLKYAARPTPAPPKVACLLPARAPHDIEDRSLDL